MKHSERFVQYYMDIAERTADMSYAVRLKVGSVIVVDNGIVSSGFNGTPRHTDNLCEHIVDGKLVTKKEVIHSEINSITRAKERNINIKGGSIFISHSPCISCSNAILESGIDTVYFKHEYRDRNGVDNLLDNGVKVIKLT